MNVEKLCLVTGVSSYVKDDRKSYTVSYLSQYNESEKENGAMGLKCNIEWTRTDLGFLQPGDVVTVLFEKGFQDRAVLSDVIVHKNLKENPYGNISQLLAGNPFVEANKTVK